MFGGGKTKTYEYCVIANAKYKKMQYFQKEYVSYYVNLIAEMNPSMRSWSCFWILLTIK